MNRRYLVVLALVAAAFIGTAGAQSFPSYYPKEGFQRTGVVDAVYPDEGRIVIGDLPYQMVKSPVVHALNAYSVSFARIRPGITVAFKTGPNRIIQEFWLLPPNYDPRRRR